MLKEGMTKLDACREWVREFNAIPQSLIVKAYMGDNIDDITEITPVSIGNYVWSNEYQGQYEIIKINREKGTATINIDGKNKKVDIDDLSNEFDDFLPMWGTMWTFGDSCDEHWLEEKENRQIMADCGFRIYETEELGYLFGIDGAGYDFYEQHWLPLYEARGLHWHDENA